MTQSLLSVIPGLLFVVGGTFIFHVVSSATYEHGKGRTWQQLVADGLERRQLWVGLAMVSGGTIGVAGSPLEVALGVGCLLGAVLRALMSQAPPAAH